MKLRAIMEKVEHIKVQQKELNSKKNFKKANYQKHYNRNKESL